MNFDWAVGGATIINPFGEYLVEPVFNEDTIVYADCEANELKAAKSYLMGWAITQDLMLLDSY